MRNYLTPGKDYNVTKGKQREMQATKGAHSNACMGGTKPPGNIGGDMSQKPTGRKSRSLPTVPEVVLGIALGCHMAWVNMIFKSMNVFAGYDQGEQLLDLVYLVSILSVSLTLLFSGIFDRRAEKLLGTNFSRIVLPLALALCTAFMPLANLEGFAGKAFAYGTGLFSGLLSGLFLLRFGWSFSLLTMRNNVIGAATASILSSLLFSLFLLFEPISACAFAASMPPVAAVLLEFGMGQLMPLQPEKTQETHREKQSFCSSEQDQSDWRRVVTKMSGCCLLIGFSNELTRTLYVQMGIANAGGTPYSLLQFVTTFGATILIIGISLALIGTKLEPRAKSCYRILNMSLIMGTLLLPLPILHEHFTVHVPHAINSAAYTCFGMFSWILVSALCNRYEQKRLRSFAFIRAAWAAGPLLGLLLGRHILHVSGLNPLPVFLAMVLATISVVSASTMVFTESDLTRAMDIVPLERRNRYQLKCANVIRRYDLSEREGEIMIMLAKGRNLPFIQNQLHLSKSTISTHRQHIYQKLDIHSQQELMDMVEASPLE